MKQKYLLAALAGCALALPILTGCGNNAPPMTDQEKANFKGGPMPADKRKEFFAKLHPNMAPPNGSAQANGNAAPNANNPAAKSNAQPGH